MANSITIDTEALTRWGTAMREGSEKTIQQNMNLAFKKSANIVMREEMRQVPRGVSSDLAGKIEQIVTTVDATIHPDPMLKYPLFVQTGTKPHMPPVDAIAEWANSKGINPWALAMSIKKKGTKANDYIGRTFDASKDAVVDTWIESIQSIADFVVSA
jgi:hypothetical protein